MDEAGRRRVAEVVRGGRRPLVRILGRDGEQLPGRAQAQLSAGDLVLVEAAEGGGWELLPPLLAGAGSWRAAMYRLAAGLGLEAGHGPAARAEAAAAHADADDPALVDLEHLPFVTVDPVGARDLDQALHLERRAGGGFLVRYALADAAHFVRPGSALLAEAVARGASLYLPGVRIPMLPPRLSEDLVSLVAGRPRRALVVECRLRPDGEVEATRVLRARVRSRARLSYRAAQRFFDDPWGAGRRHREWRASLELLAEVGRARLDEARRRRSLRVEREELELRPADGAPGGFRVAARVRAPVEAWNEQLSLLVNMEGARLLAEGLGLDRVQPVFRVHPAPSEADLERLALRLAELADRRRLDPQRWAWRPAAGPLADFLGRLPRAGRSARLARAVERQAARVQQPSRYATEPGPHFGLGAPCYARLSAPMREAVGVFTHKEVLELLGATAPGPAADDLALRDRVVEAGNRARELQRRLDKGAARAALDRWLAARPRPGEALDGTVLGFGGDRIHVQLDDPRLDLKVYLADQAEAWEVDRLELEARCEARVVRLGDHVRLAVAGLDPTRDRWRVTLVPGLG